MSFDISTIIMEIAGLSFVGLGAQAPSPEWGAMINDGRIYIQEAPWIVVFPCILLILTILLFTEFGDALNSKYNRMNWSSKNINYSPYLLGLQTKKYEYKKVIQ